MSESALKSDQQWMQEALELAGHGQGYVEPNPMVGCILTHAGHLIGSGYHRQFGGPHAEREAIADAVRRGNAGLLHGSTAFVTLEPCCHTGKTPPCTEALLESGVKRVVIAMRDPFEEVAGRGCELLGDAGLEVVVGVEEDAARSLNAPYVTRLLERRPWVIAKWAMSLDGKIATRTGHSQWISGPESRAKVQEMRSRVDAILVGSGTALADNPMLTARTNCPPRRTAVRVVFDSKLSLPIDSQLATTADIAPVLVWASSKAEPAKAQKLRKMGVQVELCDAPTHAERLELLLRHLACERHATNILAEGGGLLLGSLHDLNKIDQCDVFIAPKLIGGSQSISPIAGLGLGTVNDRSPFETIVMEPCGADMHISVVRRTLR